jgi:hypothetical protein
VTPVFRAYWNVATGLHDGASGVEFSRSCPPPDRRSCDGWQDCVSASVVLTPVFGSGLVTLSSTTIQPQMYVTFCNTTFHEQRVLFSAYVIYAMLCVRERRSPAVTRTAIGCHTSIGAKNWCRAQSSSPRKARRHWAEHEYINIIGLCEMKKWTGALQWIDLNKKFFFFYIIKINIGRQ